MSNNPIPTPRKTKPKYFVVWFFSGWNELIVPLLVIVLCLAAPCFTWVLRWRRLHGEYTTWAQFADVVNMVLGGAP